MPEILKKCERFLCGCLIFSLVSNLAHCQESAEKRDTLREAVVRADRNAFKRTKIGFERLDKSRIDNGFALFSGPDVIKTVQNLPGVVSGPELFSGLYVHGGDGADNLFLLDGIPVFQTGHIGGLFSTFNPDIIHSVDFYKSGFPARYGGRLSSIVDVRTGDGDIYEYHGNVSIALLDGRVHFGGPIVKSKSSFSVSLRRSWLDLITSPVFRIINSTREDKMSARFHFYDLNAKLLFQLGDDDRISFSQYFGRDYLKGQETDKEMDDKGVEGKDENGMLFNWGNFTSGVNYLHTSDRLTISSSVFVTGNDSKIGFTHQNLSIDKTEERMESVHNEHARYKVKDYGIMVRTIYSPSGRSSLDFGMLAARHRYSNCGDIQRLSDTVSTSNSQFSNEGTVHLEYETTIFKMLSSNIGFRLTLFDSGSKVNKRFEPRLSFALPLTPSMTVRASYTRMNQFQHLVASSYLDLPTNMWMPSTERAAPMSSNQYSIGLYLADFHNVDVSFDGWWKDMDGVMLYDGISSFFPPVDNWETRFYSGRGKSYGIELSSEYADDKIQAALYYTLSWSKRRFDKIYGAWFSDHLDSRNKITVTATWKPNDHFDMTATWNYHTGYRMTMPTHIITDGTSNYDSENGENYIHISEELYLEPNSIKLPDYHRLDIGCNFRRTTRSGYRRVWNISVYNAYCRLNPLFMVPVQRYSEGYRGKVYAIIPIIPSVGYSLTF